MARKQTFSLFGKRFTNEQEYIAARNQWLGYEGEQEQAHREAIEQDSKVNGTVVFTVLAGDQSAKGVWIDGQIVTL